MTSKFLRHIACEHCGSTDANSLYDDGHTHCFKCGTTEHEGAYDERTVIREAFSRMRKKDTMEIKGTSKSIPDRGISQATCEKYGVTTDGDNHITLTLTQQELERLLNNALFLQRNSLSQETSTEQLYSVSLSFTKEERLSPSQKENLMLSQLSRCKEVSILQ
jgi:transcription initiation factor TFIIIB Brf1 subunit/transcription initiation factor TFIIB